MELDVSQLKGVDMRKRGGGRRTADFSPRDIHRGLGFVGILYPV